MLLLPFLFASILSVISTSLNIHLKIYFYKCFTWLLFPAFGLFQFQSFNQLLQMHLMLSFL
jgi:hypothetical protein